MFPNFILRRNWLFTLLVFVTLGAAEAMQEGFEQGYFWACKPKGPRPAKGIWMAWAFELGFMKGVTKATVENEEHKAAVKGHRAHMAWMRKHAA